MFLKSYELGYDGKAFMGDAFHSALNPPLGAVSTYHLRDGLQTLTELDELRGLVVDLEVPEAEMEAAGAPWTPGRIPDWRPE